MKTVDSSPCYNCIFAFIGSGLRSLYHWTATCTQILSAEYNKLMSRTWKIRRTARRFLPSGFCSRPCACWKELIFDARTRAGGSAFGLYVCYWNTLECVTPCVACSCKNYLPLQLSPASCTACLRCLNQTMEMGRLGSSLETGKQWRETPSI